ncbi:MAG: 50S ribosomal protein L5 [Chloroflexi bacterium]|nr:50S ribosomal protein L5 [Chloroflexota bacterium]
MSELMERYRKEVVPALRQELGYKNVMQVPRLEKIVVNIGLGEAIQNPKALEAAQQDLEAITGQHPITTRAKKAVANFHLRKGMPIGLKVTLRGRRMYDFFQRLVGVALPRLADFHGTSPEAFDGRGGYSLGLKEQAIFPEVEYDKIDKVRGLQVTIATTASTPEEARRLLSHLGMPFARG